MAPHTHKPCCDDIPLVQICVMGMFDPKLQSSCLSVIDVCVSWLHILFAVFPDIVFSLIQNSTDIFGKVGFASLMLSRMMFLTDALL